MFSQHDTCIMTLALKVSDLHLAKLEQVSQSRSNLNLTKILMQTLYIFPSL